MAIRTMSCWMKIARSTQRPGQTKEQTKLIAQGIQKGIDQYKAQLEGEVNKRLDSEKGKIGDKLKGVLGY